MGFWLWATVVLAITFARVLGSRETVKQCLNDYIPKIIGFELDPKYKVGLRVITKDLDNIRSEPPPLKVVLDVGLGSMWHSDVFRQMVQLNVSGLDEHLRTSFNCEYESFPRKDAISFKNALIRNNGTSSFVYSLGLTPHLPLGNTWLKVLAMYQDIKVLMNDVTDEEYYSSRYVLGCNREWHKKVQEHCYVPLLAVPHHKINVTSEPNMLNKFTFDQVKVMLSAYRELIKCIVPPENLFQFNLNQMPAVEYWSKLTSFLNIGLPASGVKYLSEGGSVCDSEKQHTDGRHVKRVQCADEYSASIASIYGEKFRVFVRDQLLKTLYTPLRAPEDTDRLVLGIGPGTTGTRTVFFSTSQLQVSAMHYQTVTTAPHLKKPLTRSDFELDMKALELESADRRVFWSDNPVPTRWWYLLKRYPNTNFMITDVGNDTLWWVKRHSGHCNRSILINDPSCTVPLPFRYDKSPLAMDFFWLAQIKMVSMDTLHRTYDAYRDLVRCVIPQDKIWWVNLSKLTSSEEYWTKLIDLVQAKISPSRKSEFIARGIPRCGSAGCYWGGQKYNVTY